MRPTQSQAGRVAANLALPFAVLLLSWMLAPAPSSLTTLRTGTPATAIEVQLAAHSGCAPATIQVVLRAGATQPSAVDVLVVQPVMGQIMQTVKARRSGSVWTIPSLCSTCPATGSCTCCYALARPMTSLSR